ncbi:hypothetical protein CQ065_06975 [Pseudomonas sp. MYb187]|uniref:hypothetical protein n=1 Tax=Pseudomonas TaxID=286 RepID=UPI000CFDA19E|nr:hypothetical protein [Pseudomonas sp. MYb187]PRA69318.1 hypothetical protein CQ065_06975 [Pseudomonas sp. MYb187]
MDMICDRCGKTGIHWIGPLSNLTHTECPHCGGQNCQREDQPENDEPEVATCGCGAAGEVNYDDGNEQRYYCYSSLSMCSP